MSNSSEQGLRRAFLIGQEFEQILDRIRVSVPNDRFSDYCTKEYKGLAASPSVIEINSKPVSLLYQDSMTIIGSVRDNKEVDSANYNHSSKFVYITWL